MFVTTLEVSSEQVTVHIAAVLTNTADTAAQGSLAVTIGGAAISTPVSVPAKNTRTVELTVWK